MLQSRLAFVALSRVVPEGIPSKGLYPGGMGGGDPNQSLLYSPIHFVLPVRVDKGR